MTGDEIARKVTASVHYSVYDAIRETGQNKISRWSLCLLSISKLNCDPKNFTFLTTREATWYIISVMSVCLYYDNFQKH